MMNENGNIRPARTISRTEYLQLEGLAALAKKHYLLVEECISAMQAIIATPNREHLCDAVFSDLPIDRALEEMQIGVSRGVVQ